jgi:hypothetical protein
MQDKHPFGAYIVDPARGTISRRIMSVAPIVRQLTWGQRYWQRLSAVEVFYQWNTADVQIPAERFLALVDAKHFTWPPPPQAYGEPPLVDAYLCSDHPGTLMLWCQFCGRWHLHGSGRTASQHGVGSGDGHRVAHCALRGRSDNTPWAGRGYILREVGTMAHKAMKQQERQHKHRMAHRCTHTPCGCKVCQQTPDNPCTVRYWPHDVSQCSKEEMTP